MTSSPRVHAGEDVNAYPGLSSAEPNEASRLLAIVETLTGEQRLEQPDEVAIYTRAFDRLAAAALAGEQAAELARQTMNRL